MTSEAWLKDYMKLCDNKDVDNIMKHWASDAVLQFGSAEPLVGAEAIRSWFVEFMDGLAHQTHKLGRVWDSEDGFVFFEAEVDNVRLDGGELTVQGLTVCRVEDQQFLHNRTYVDIAPVFAPSMPASA